MSSQLGFLAKTSATQEPAPDFPVSVQDSIGRHYEPFAWYDRAMLCWRTWQLCLDGEWEQFSGTWPRSAMIRNMIAFALVTSVLLTDEIESGYLPTPTAREGRDWSQAQILARLDRGDGVAKRICNLSPMLRLSEQIVGLNPCFAEWMMGYPEGWTACMGSATRSSRRSRK